MLLVGGKEADCVKIAEEFGYTKFITLNQYVKTHPYLIPSNPHDLPSPVEQEPIAAVFILREPYDWYVFPFLIFIPKGTWPCKWLLMC